MEHILFPYQKSWIENKNRFKIWLKSRQIGASFTLALEAVLTALEHKRHLCVLLSSSERQSKELMEKVRLHVSALKETSARFKETFFSDTRIRQLEVEFANGSRIIGLPANPDTARGFTGDIWLDEFAFHKDNRKIWQALYPSITWGFAIRVSSTPLGKSDMFYHLWTEAGQSEKWYAQKTDIYDAVNDGLPANIEELKEGCKDPDAWAMEYECQFMDEADSLLTFEMIEKCEDINASLNTDLREIKNPLFAGIDIGRRKDLTVIYALEQVGDVLWTRLVTILKKMPFHQQFEYIDTLMPFFYRVAIDETGIGMMLAEELKRKWGETKVLPVYFTAKTKEELASRVQTKFQDRLIRIPIERDLRLDLHSVRKVVTSAGNIKLDVEKTDLGHADRFWALALGVYAASLDVAGPITYISLERRRYRQKEGIW